jgi:hypothetical protein
MPLFRIKNRRIWRITWAMSRIPNIFRVPKATPQCNAYLDEAGGQWRYLWIITLERLFGEEIKGKATPEKEPVPKFSAGESVEERL